MSFFQQTIKEPITIAGIGLHTNERVKIKIRPASSNAGIRFLRTDLDNQHAIPARTDYVVDTRFSTTVGINGSSISTIEHIMAAFSGMGVDNALVEIDGPEVPSLDGSAYPFAVKIRQAGLVVQKEPRRFIEIIEPVSVGTEDKGITISPARHFRVDMSIHFDHPLIQGQQFGGKINSKIFFNKISRARTFGFLKEVEWLQKNGFARGGSLENAVVLGDTALLNKEGLRFPDEFVRHKVLDLIGDLYLLGGHILGEIIAYKSGHEVHHLLSKKLQEQPSSWRLRDRSHGSSLPLWPLEGGNESVTLPAASC